ncbi:MAG: hypothetical protein ACOY4H_15800, partial [Thermodesulfobacteriota bacterium]
SSGIRAVVYPAEGEYTGTVTVCLNDDPATPADESAVCDSETVSVNAVVVEPEVLGVDFTSAVAGKTVTLTGANLDPTIVRAYIYWGDRKSSSVNAAQLAAGVAHTYTIGGKSYDISVKVLAADYSQTVYAVGDDGDLRVTLP